MGHPALPVARYIRTVLLAGVHGFFVTQLLAVKPVPYRYLADAPTLIGQLRGRCPRGHMRLRGDALPQPRLNSTSSLGFLPPLGFAATLPVSRRCGHHRANVATPTPAVSAFADKGQDVESLPRKHGRRFEWFADREISGRRDASKVVVAQSGRISPTSFSWLPSSAAAPSPSAITRRRPLSIVMINPIVQQAVARLQLRGALRVEPRCLAIDEGVEGYRAKSAKAHFATGDRCDRTTVHQDRQSASLSRRGARSLGSNELGRVSTITNLSDERVRQGGF
jgi:hypothetical protein